ncbi:MAG: hypothetical protein PHP54_03445 [Clostridia bacterium]|nr:hypothetical protein [Clostridia bacterium]
MEDSALEALYTGAYIFVFIVALTITLYLFGSITNFANLAYDYNTEVQGGATIVETPVEQDILLNINEVISYYYNYVARDLYGNEENNGTITTDSNNAVITKYNVTIEGLMQLPRDATIKDIYAILAAKDGKDSKYILTYNKVSYDTKDNVKIVDISIKRATNIEFF